MGNQGGFKDTWTWTIMSWKTWAHDEYWVLHSRAVYAKDVQSWLRCTSCLIQTQVDSSSFVNSHLALECVSTIKFHFPARYMNKHIDTGIHCMCRDQTSAARLATRKGRWWVGPSLQPRSLSHCLSWLAKHSPDYWRTRSEGPNLSRPRKLSWAYSHLIHMICVDPRKGELAGELVPGWPRSKRYIGIHVKKKKKKAIWTNTARWANNPQNAVKEENRRNMEPFGTAGFEAGRLVPSAKTFLDTAGSFSHVFSLC